MKNMMSIFSDQILKISIDSNNIKEALESIKKIFNDDNSCFRRKYNEAEFNSFFLILESVIENYNKGDLSKSLLEFKKALIVDESCILEEYTLKKNGPAKFRMRTNPTYQLLKKQEMFHIPFDQRNIINNQRYSILGFPCLYIGSSLYDCWEELRRPNLEKINYVAINNTKDLKLIDISLPKKIENFNDIKRTIIFILCTLIVKNDDSKFKYEYIFPQLILQTIISLKKYDGIRYLSSRYFKKDFLFLKEEKNKPLNSLNIMYNYVIPIKIETDNYCTELLKEFKVSDTFSPYLYKVRMISFSKAKCRINEYRQSIFYKYETAPEISKLALIRLS